MVRHQRDIRLQGVSTAGACGLQNGGLLHAADVRSAIGAPQISDGDALAVGTDFYVDDSLVRNVDQGWWINLRPSNTEPLLRLNVEARDADQMAALRDEVLGIVR